MTLQKRTASKSHALHRIKQVRIAEDVSLRSVARRMNQETSILRDQEQEDTDLTLTELYRWQAALNVPVQELLIEPERALSEPIRTRASLIRMATTAKAVLKTSTTRVTRCLAQDLLHQLIDMMPELKSLLPELNYRRSWRELKTRGTSPSLGRTAERIIDTKWINGDAD